MKAEQVDALVEIEQPLGDVMQAKEFLVTAIQIVHADPRLAQLGVKSLAQPRTDVEQGQETRRIQAAAVSQAGANQMVVIRRDRLQFVQHGDRILQHVISTAQKLGGVEEIALRNQPAGAIQLPGNSLQQ